MKKIFLLAAVFVCGASMAQRSTRTPASILNHFLHPAPDYVLVTAHRGDWHDAPENSIEALNGALEIGVDIMETDVRKTKDGVLILMHDGTINRTTVGKGRVSDYSWDSLKNVALCKENGIPTRQHIPSFESLMEAVRGKPILINLDKCWDIIPEVYAVLKKTGTVEQALFKGPFTIEKLREKFGPLIDSIHYIPMVNPGGQPHTAAYRAEVDRFVSDFVTGYRPAGFELSFESETSPIYREALPKIRKAGISIFVNSLWGSQCADHDDEKALKDPAANWGWLISQGVNVIQTDQPQQLLDYLRRKKLHD